MNVKRISLLFFLCTYSAYAQMNPLRQSQCDPKVSLAVEIDFDELFNPTPEQQEFIYSIEQKPTSTFVLWLAKIGMPFLDAFFCARKFARTTWHWILHHLQQTSKTDNNE